MTIRKRIVINTAVLKEYMEKEELSYQKLADRAGMPSVATAYEAVQGKGGLSAMAYLLTLNLPGLFLLEETQMLGKKSRITTTPIFIAIGIRS